MQSSITSSCYDANAFCAARADASAGAAVAWVTAGAPLKALCWVSSLVLLHFWPTAATWYQGTTLAPLACDHAPLLSTAQPWTVFHKAERIGIQRCTRQPL